MKRARLAVFAAVLLSVAMAVARYARSRTSASPPRPVLASPPLAPHRRPASTPPATPPPSASKAAPEPAAPAPTTPPLPAPPLPAERPATTPVPGPAASPPEFTLGPAGIVLWDDVPMFASAESTQPSGTLRTGDAVRVLSAQAEDGRWLVRPGVSIYADVSAQPRREGWVDEKNLTLFDAATAEEFADTTEPVTLGNDDSFSMVDFYTRALSNPDPGVHRLIGRRMVELLSIHEEYVPAWGALYRDADPSVRSAALAALRARGTGGNRALMEDLLARLNELTETRATGLAEAEALTLLDILRQNPHPRSRAALQGLEEAWKSTQSERLNRALRRAIDGQP